MYCVIYISNVVLDALLMKELIIVSHLFIFGAAF